MFIFRSCCVFYILNLVYSQDPIVKFVLVSDKGQEDFVTLAEDSLKSNNLGGSYNFVQVILDENSNTFDEVCNAFIDGGTIILDISYSGYDSLREIANDMNLPYLKIDVSISPFLNILDGYLDARNSTDVALIFQDPKYIDEALYYWIDSTRLRMVITEKLDSISAQRLKDMRPSPNNYAVLATSDTMNVLYKQIFSEGLLTRSERWNLVLLDFNTDTLEKEDFAEFVNIIIPNKAMCCEILKDMDCNCLTSNDLAKRIFEAVFDKLLTQLDAISKAGNDIGMQIKCNDTQYNEVILHAFEKGFSNAIMDVEDILYEGDIVRVRSQGSIEIMDNEGKSEVVAKYIQGEDMELVQPHKVKPVKPFYRVGTTAKKPWSYQDVDPVTGELFWTGYCIDFATKLAERMNFDFEIVIPKKGTYGNKDQYGNWDGVIGDLATGETDLAIAAITMTADREEVVDFVPPYFEQVGISIVMRKPVRRTSLFKFMTVLKLEVWLSIVGALIVTGFMVWFLDKYSPYSARNNKKAYPYPCRHFNLKESFWFALTSFTPQGGGEAPKALSGRTLVAAYWLFVVLMLATFTANLAAFLTVERMQTPVQSLEQLARQSRINYTVVESSETHKYFINMKFAEDTLYRMWKELVLNASTDETQYRVWDYPIREQYGQILIAINDSMPVPTPEAGFLKVNERLDADFAFIHDSSEIKYEISRNCNLTEVGDVFAEKPYAVVVQQGSHLQDAISINILDLQKDRFFESLQAKYWNHSNKGDCANADDNEGITLESLGGVFIATLFGLALAMITLAGEVFYYKRKKKNEVEELDTKKVQPISKIELSKFAKPGGPGTVTIGDKFTPAPDRGRIRMSHISMYPRSRNRLPMIE